MATSQAFPDADMPPLAFFEATADGFEPLPFANSAWSPTMINGPAVCGLLARALENAHCPAGFLPSRLTVDMFRPPQKATTTVLTSVVREGNRIVVADAVFRQGEQDMARATAVFLKLSEQPPGERWTRDAAPVPPEVPPADGPTVPLWNSNGRPDGWTGRIGDHQNSGHKKLWQAPISAVLGEAPSPFVGAAIIGESTSLLTNWSEEGVGFINADLTLALTRPGEGLEIGLEADNHLSADGVAVGSATLFDRRGAFGTCVVTALANAQRAVNFGKGYRHPSERLAQ
ncbi:acyl-CoA thioesterase domain-containing protein [Nocardia sp. NPDC127579]|uniref:acyl-CoA thioesterase domain-containing protein n=1 Tax=Nocardia sp. NPDC127579 TaxID=3345402 RepID=UPI003645CA0F